MELSWSAPRNRGAGIASALVAAFLAGGTNVAIRATVTSGISPLAATAVAFVAGALVLVPLLRGAGIARRDWPRLALSVVSGAVIAPLLLFHGLALTTAADGALVLNAEMAFAAILAYVVLGERPRRSESWGLGALALGAVVVSLGAERAGETRLAGALMVAGAALGWAIDSVASTPLTQRYDVRRVVAWKLALGAAVLLPMALMAGDLPVGIPASTWLLLLAIGALGTALATTLFYVALARVGATRTVVVFSTQTIIGALLAWLVLREELTPFHGGGLALAALGITLLARPEPGQDQDGAPPKA